jgi:murein DD-endopeptidase MepM/ murein hydrolase activator NlpD
MRPLAQRLLLLAAGAAILLASGSTGASARGTAAVSPASNALAIRVTVPGEAGAAAAAASAPKDTVAMGGAFAYPADGSIARVSSVNASAFAVTSTAAPSASATSEAQGVVLFNGEVTVSTVTAKAKVQAGPKGASGDSTGSQVAGLTISGAGMTAGPGARFNLGDWGYVVTLAQAAYPNSKGGGKGYVITQTALLVHLNIDHGGLPAGSEIMVGYADAFAEAAPAPPPPPKPRRVKPAKKPAPPDDRLRPKNEEKRRDGLEPGRIPPLLPVPQGLDVRLTSGRYVFPVYGSVSFADTFAAGRADTGWHHGEDIFAPLGAPILAVTDGTVFSVGWNDIGGLRVWLRDRYGNEFYYAHLSAFSQLAVNGKQVEAGDVLGFVGNTGDAEHTPYHLHFEIHPVSLLDKGYDGVVPPHRYLIAWQKLSDVAIAGVTTAGVAIASVAGWAAPVAPGASAPRPGAILLQVSDISRASGLEPGSFGRAMREAAVDRDGSLVGVRARFAALLRRLTGR